jgi:CubicO group peptidase (beta-lactamase class C family)
MGLQLGVNTPDETLELASGFSYFDRKHLRNSTKAKPSDIFLMGSTTKMYTAAAILGLVQSGNFRLDDKAFRLMDPLYRRLNGTNGTSLDQVLGPQVREVTVRQLLNMRSGIPDFDDGASRHYQLEHPEQDLGPVRNIGFVPKSTENNSLAPDVGGQYSSTNYELLGLILAQQAQASSWDTYNQSMSIPANLQQEMKHTKFGVHGTCEHYGTVHGLTIDGLPWHKPSDVYNMSCTNGWTCGNLLSSAGDAAKFVKALLGPGERVLNADLQNEMLNLTALTHGWSVGLPYGLGLMDLSHWFKLPSKSFVGHGGATYGFLSFTGYMKDIDVGFSIVANVEVPIISHVAREAIQAIREHFHGLASTIVV